MLRGFENKIRVWGKLQKKIRGMLQHDVCKQNKKSSSYFHKTYRLYPKYCLVEVCFKFQENRLKINMSISPIYLTLFATYPNPICNLPRLRGKLQKKITFTFYLPAGKGKGIKSL
uniref:Uncharacterized protein n=1 Tax=Cacopsylla melanoneura TaxID=428564 RepID=A0A8D9BD83_9HEMI